MEKSLISIRIDKDTKEKATAIFESVGLNMSSAISAFLNVSIAEGKIPFELKSYTDTSYKLNYIGMYLFYNPYEYPSKIHFRSEKLGIDEVYDPNEATEKNLPADIPDLIKLANKTSDYDDISVYLTPHEQGYFRKTKSLKKLDFTIYKAVGWISLKGVKNGGEYLDDPCLTRVVVDKDGNRRELR